MDQTGGISFAPGGDAERHFRHHSHGARVAARGGLLPVQEQKPERLELFHSSPGISDGAARKPGAAQQSTLYEQHAYDCGRTGTTLERLDHRRRSDWSKFYFGAELGSGIGKALGGGGDFHGDAGAPATMGFARTGGSINAERSGISAGLRQAKGGVSDRTNHAQPECAAIGEAFYALL